jgi:hypothetical protein
MLDNMRGMDANLNPTYLLANNSGAENTNPAIPYGVSLTSTGFNVPNTSNFNQAGVTSIYIAIRRGPMKVPTVGTSVYQGVTYTGNAAYNMNIYTVKTFVTDWLLSWDRTLGATGVDSSNSAPSITRLVGFGVNPPALGTYSTSAEASSLTLFTGNTSQYNYVVGGSSGRINRSGDEYIGWNFGRAPSFMDVVCYAGTGSATTVTHNLAAVPELIIVKSRNGGAENWRVYYGVNQAMALNTTGAGGTASPVLWNDTAPTSSVFSVGTSTNTNGSGYTYVAYLFATCAGVSKVGSYTGNGSSQTINCGFTGGARFVLIKKTSGTGSWYVWDSSRGIVSGNDPYLLLNSTAAEVTNTDYIDTYSAGFEISSTAPSEINENGGSFIFLAIA